MKKILSLVLCLMLLLSAAALAAPQASEVLIEASKKKYDSFKGEITLDVSANVDAGGLAMSIPVTGSGNVEYDGKVSHGVVNVQMNLFGSDSAQSYEFYADSENQMGYITSDGGMTWIKSSTSGEDTEIDMSDPSKIVDQIKGEDISAFDAAATVTEENGGYAVSIPLTYLVETAQKTSLKEQMEGAQEAYGELYDQVMAALSGIAIKLTVNADGYLDGFHMNNLEVHIDTEYEGQPTKVDTSGDIDFNITEINKGGFTVTIPEDVINNAVESSEAAANVDGGFEIDGGDMEIEVGEETGEGEGIEVETEIDDDGVEVSGGDAEEAPAGGDLNLGNMPADALGALNGENFAKGGHSWAIWNDDGWKPEYEGEYNFLILTNDKYDKYFNCTVFSYPYTDNVTVDILREKGVGGYDLSVYKLDGVNPEMTWCGLTWGASRDLVKAAYGEPAFEYESNDGSSMSCTYWVDEAHNWDLCFRFTDGRLTGVKLDCSR